MDGVSGRPFFDEDTTGSSDLSLDANLVANTEILAASLDGARGDNKNAIALQDIENRMALRNNTMALAESYQALIGDLGARSRSAAAATETQNLIVEKLENGRDSISGVSLDEEAANLISQQRAYQSAARLVRTADEMMESLLGMLR